MPNDIPLTADSDNLTADSTEVTADATTYSTTGTRTGLYVLAQGSTLQLNFGSTSSQLRIFVV